MGNVQQGTASAKPAPYPIQVSGLNIQQPLPNVHPPAPHGTVVYPPGYGQNVDINGHPIQSSGVLTSQQLQNVPYSRYDQSGSNWLWILLIIILIIVIFFVVFRSRQYY